MEMLCTSQYKVEFPSHNNICPHPCPAPRTMMCGVTRRWMILNVRSEYNGWFMRWTEKWKSRYGKHHLGVERLFRGILVYTNHQILFRQFCNVRIMIDDLFTCRATLFLLASGGCFIQSVWLSLRVSVLCIECCLSRLENCVQKLFVNTAMYKHVA